MVTKRIKKSNHTYYLLRLLQIKNYIDGGSQISTAVIVTTSAEYRANNRVFKKGITPHNQVFKLRRKIYEHT